MVPDEVPEEYGVGHCAECGAYTYMKTCSSCGGTNITYKPLYGGQEYYSHLDS